MLNSIMENPYCFNYMQFFVRVCEKYIYIYIYLSIYLSI